MNKKRRVTTEELSKMESAIFIWKRNSGEYAIGKVVFSKLENGFFVAYPIGFVIATARSIEETMLKAQILCLGERFFEVDDTLMKEEFCSPFSFLDLLQPEWHVNEVIL